VVARPRNQNQPRKLYSLRGFFVSEFRRASNPVSDRCPTGVRISTLRLRSIIEGLRCLIFQSIMSPLSKTAGIQCLERDAFNLQRIALYAFV
jgi:hypothetical protein